MSVKRAFFGVFQKLVVFCCAIFFGFANAFSANLPTGYTELEYIESSGTQYIDTGVLGTDKTSVHIKYVATSLSQSSGFGIIGYQRGFKTSPSFQRVLWTSMDNNQFRYGNKLTDTFKKVNKNEVIEETFGDGSWIYNGENIPLEVTTSFTTSPDTMVLFGLKSSSGVASFAKIKLYFCSIKENGTLVANYIPARRNSDNVLGMYDTVNNVFSTNQGTGEFTAGPAKCRNLFDEVYPNPTGAPKYKAIYVGEGTFTCSYTLPNQSGNTSMVYFLPGNVSAGANNRTNQVDATHPRTVTAVDGYVTIAYRNGTSIGMGNAVPSDYHAQIERGATATDYVPFCSTKIKIATTAYNSARFSPVVNDLNSTVATIREIVTNTINQTAAIASLQADKQTRPEDACPAGKKCLLVETEENGVIVPHWYPIIESADD